MSHEHLTKSRISLRVVARFLYVDEKQERVDEFEQFWTMFESCLKYGPISSLRMKRSLFHIATTVCSRPNQKSWKN